MSWQRGEEVHSLRDSLTLMVSIDSSVKDFGERILIYFMANRKPKNPLSAYLYGAAFIGMNGVLLQTSAPTLSEEELQSCRAEAQTVEIQN